MFLRINILQERPAITFNYPAGSLQINAGEELRIVCTATGDPTPMVSWEKLNGYMLVFGYIHTHIYFLLSSRVSLLENFPMCFLLCRPSENPSPNSAVYSVPTATKENEGSYLCRAKNAAGETEDLIQIIVNENGGNDGGRIGRHNKLMHS